MTVSTFIGQSGTALLEQSTTAEPLARPSLHQEQTGRRVRRLSRGSWLRIQASAPGPQKVRRKQEAQGPPEPSVPRGQANNRAEPSRDPSRRQTKPESTERHWAIVRVALNQTRWSSGPTRRSDSSFGLTAGAFDQGPLEGSSADVGLRWRDAVITHGFNREGRCSAGEPSAG
jgi:hypothetical protein